MNRSLLLLFFVFSVYSDTLDVAIYDFPPCVIIEEGKKPTGFDIEILESICKSSGLEIRYKYPEKFPDLLKGVEEGLYDCAVSGITITGERESNVDFTHPYLNSGLSILLRSDSKINFFKTIFRYISEFAPMLILITIFTAFFGVSIYFIERIFSKKESQFNPDKPGIGIFNGYYFGNVASTTMGFGDFVPKSFPGKILTIIMAYIGIYFTIPYATANMNMAMQKEYEVYSISGPENLPGKIVGTEKETTSETFLKNSGCDLRTFDRIDEAYKSLEAKKLDAVVFDMPTIMYLIKNDKKKKFKISGGVFDRQMYGFALKKESQYRKIINEKLADFMRTPTYWEIYDKWFGTN